MSNDLYIEAGKIANTHGIGGDVVADSYCDAPEVLKALSSLYIKSGSEYKKLTIKSEVGTVLSPCSSTADSNHHGIFYLTSKASGTVIEGFTFTGKGMLYGNGDYGILINGASNVIIRNCTFTDMDSGDAIRLENAKSITIDNVKSGQNLNSFSVVSSSCYVGECESLHAEQHYNC